MSPCQPCGRSPARPHLLLRLREEGSCLPQPSRSTGLPVQVCSAQSVTGLFTSLAGTVPPQHVHPREQGEWRGEDTVPLTFISRG